MPAAGRPKPFRVAVSGTAAFLVVEEPLQRLAPVMTASASDVRVAQLIRQLSLLLRLPSSAGIPQAASVWNFLHCTRCSHSCKPVVSLYTISNEHLHWP